MICIFEKNATEFGNNGLATLEPVECLFTPAINGVWRLDMSLPYDPDNKSLLVANERILKVTGIDCIEEYTGNYQLFRIADVKRGDSTVDVIAYPIGLDARFDVFIRSLKLYNPSPTQGEVEQITASEAISKLHALTNKYNITGSGYGTEKNYAEYNNTNLIAVINGEDSFVQKWDGEACYDNYNIKLNHRLGINASPVDVRYGKNIMGMSYDLDASNVATRLYPRAKSGEYLNAIADYKIANNQYVDATNASDYPIPHTRHIDTPYSLVQLSNDGSREYSMSNELYNEIKILTAFWLRDSLTVDTVYDGLLNEIELGWILNNYALTAVKDGVVGIVEYLARKIWNNSYHNILSGTVQSLIYNAMKAGFDEVLSNDQSEFYIGAETKSWRNNFYSYTWDVNGEFRVRAEAEDVAWIYATSKWHQIGEDGYATGVTDTAKWKWYKKKVNNVTIKRYGNKKKNRYLHNQWWKINDVWYWFNANGEGKKAAWLNNTYYEYFEEAEIPYGGGSDKTIYELLLPISIAGEADLFELLYEQMTAYCYYVYETDGLSYPVIKLEVNIVDLSQTTEYKDYQILEKIKLGNTVNITNPKVMPLPSTERVIGLTYDVLRKCNTEIKIGLTESSLVNLLESIGKKTDDYRLVAGEGVTIENNTISVTPPSTPYLEDVIVNGASVVRNHKAYIDLDEMGIDETIDVLFGTEEPDSDDGEDKDIYVKLKPSLTPQDLELSAHSIYQQESISRDVDLLYNIVLGGTSASEDDEYVAYKIKGLKEGKTYTFSFDGKMSDGCEFYDGWISGGELTGQSIVGITFQKTAEYYNDMPAYPGDYNEEYRYMSFYRDDSSHHYTNTFVATSDTMYMIAEFNGVKDGTYRTMTLSNLSIKEYEIEKVFFKYEDDWMKAGVTANPTNRATESLTKIKINGVVYNISGSGGASAISDLTDVDLNSLTNGDILKYNDQTDKWENAQMTLLGLEDVSYSQPNNGDILAWDSTLGKWVNVSGGGGGSSNYIGSSVPSSVVGTEGSLYMQTDTSFCAFNGKKTSNAWVNFIHITADMTDAVSVTVKLKSGSGGTVLTKTINISDFVVNPYSSDPDWDGCDRDAIVPDTNSRVYLGYSTQNPTYITAFTGTGTLLTLYEVIINTQNASRIKDVFGKTNGEWLKYNPYESFTDYSI